LGETSDRTGSPANALAVVMVIAIVAFVAQRIGGVSAVNAFFYPGAIGVLSMLVTYIVVNVGALRFLFLSRRVRAWEAILVYVIYANIYPVPDFPLNIFPYVVAAWLVLGLGIVLLVPGLARRIGANLAEREGLAIEESTIP
jgi:amino acid permease